MFRRYPYKGWLILCILLWGLAAYRYYTEQQKVRPEQMAAAIQARLNEYERSFEKITGDQDLLQRMFSERLTEKEVARLSALPYRIFAYTHENELVFWNTNKILEECGGKTGNGDSGEKLLRNDRGDYVKRCFTPAGFSKDKKLLVLYPIARRFAFENKYLRSGFVAGNYIPVSTRVLSQQIIGSHPVKSIDGQPVFHLLFSQSDIPEPVPDGLLLCIIAAAFIVTVAWIQLITISITRKRSFWVGLSITLIAIVGLRWLTYVYGLPFDLDRLDLFSPFLYASGSIQKSLGDLIINALCFLWLVVFTLRHVPFNIFKERKLSTVWQWLLALLISGAMVAYSFVFVDVIGSLVLDSMISFDVSHFYSVTRYTIAGLLAVCTIAAASCLLIYIINVWLRSILRNAPARYLLIAAVGVTATLLYGHNEVYRYVLVVWLVLFLILIDRRSLITVKDIMEPQTIFWGVFLCLLSTGILQYFNFKKERETRKRFAEQVALQRDEITEYTFKSITQGIGRDKLLKIFFSAPGPDGRRNINERFDALYLTGHLNKYRTDMLLFDAEGKGLYNNDTISYKMLNSRVEHAIPTADSMLYYRENARAGHYYLARIPIYSDTDMSRLLGTVFIDLAINESEGETVYPELLQPESVTGTINESNYSYAVYLNNLLMTQTGDHSFVLYLPADTAGNMYTFYEWGKLSELQYRPNKEKTVIVVADNKLIIQSITLFSYLFGVQMLMVLLVVGYRLVLSYLSKPYSEKLISFTLRKRIHFSMLGIVFVSFILIGAVTIIFFNIQYTQTNRGKLRRSIQAVERSVLQYLNAESALINSQTFNDEIGTTRFRYFIANIANLQKVDINIYRAGGTLKVTSQDAMYDKSLLARIIMPDAYFNVFRRSTSLHIQQEQIGTLSYLSSYVPIRDQYGYTVGYINVPYFASEKELKYQISNILVALINIYAFIFLISGLLTVFITRWITKTFSVMIKRFESFRLGSSNELIEWPYDDEIGLLLKEYNKMVKKVEESAAMLAQSEREGAWREMAKQVAHEIKNPLTPMKLNIQYLQQALKNDQPNVKELAIKVSKSLVEQIDNLSYIANEFSNFAKMPEARPALLDLNELLERAVELYPADGNVSVRFERPGLNHVVHADKSQLTRVCSNLLQNAVQAIPDDVSGMVEVRILRQGREAIISVTDNGRGIADDVKDKIFRPYFTTRSSGTGLGLAMTKKIIEFWKGRIWFETEEGKGTTFYIALPLVNIMAQ